MKLTDIVILGAFALSVSACSTTPAPDDLGDLVYTGFSEKSDGTAYHRAMGMSCPSQIDGIPRTSTKVYNDAGTDIGCNYSGGGRILTIYLSQYPQFDLPLIFKDAKAAIEYRFAEQGYVYDEALSDACSSESLDETSILSGLSGLLSGENKTNEITLSPSPSAVYTKGTDMTLVVVDEMFDHEFFKVRYTGAFAGEASVESACEMIRNTYLRIETGVRQERGLKPSSGTSLLDMINLSEGS